MRRDLVLTALLAALITLVALAPIGWVLYRNQPPRLATVDLQSIVDEHQQQFIQALSKETVTDADRAAAMQRTEDFAKKLSATVDALGTECDCLIVNKAALLAGRAVDYTALVQTRLKQ